MEKRCAERDDNSASQQPIQSSNTNDTREVQQWKADQTLMEALMSMGFARNTATKALFYTNNTSAELAISWIFENPIADTSESSDDIPISDLKLCEDCKMVFVINSSLDMGVGKIAAQTAHAAIAMHAILLDDQQRFGASLMQWLECGQTKIVLKAQSMQQLVELERKAMSVGLPTHLVVDAGRTQIKSGSTTVLCVFGRIDLVDEVTGHLKLL